MHLVVKNHPFHDHDMRFDKGNDWWGGPDNHVVAQPADLRKTALAIELLCRAIWLDDLEKKIKG